jgi:ribonuclease Z
MLSPEHHEEAEKKGHMTVDEAARIAAASSVHRAVLVHISPRYKEEDLEQLAAAASQRFERIEMGRDLQGYNVPVREG